LFDGALLLRVAAQDPRIAVARASELPFAMIGRAADNAGLTFVDVDIDAAVDMAVDHLHALGHQRLAFLRPPDLRDGWAARGLAAYELACARRRIRLLTALMPSNTHDARLAALSLLRERNELTGILAWSEWAGWAAMLAAADAGLRVPDDLSIVCLWHGAGSELLPFAPARVDLRAEQLAEAAVALLLQQVDGDEPGEQQVLLQPELIVGESAAPPWRV
jgi:LacI family transcriptional regulator